jgi:hypothetical protein
MASASETKALAANAKRDAELAKSPAVTAIQNVDTSTGVRAADINSFYQS